MKPGTGALAAFADVMADRHPHHRWLPVEGPRPDAPSPDAGQTVRPLTPPEDQRPLTDRDVRHADAA